MLDPDPNDQKEVRLLNRVIAWGSDGMRSEPDQRHTEILVWQLGLQGSIPKGLGLPGSKDTAQEDADGASHQPVVGAQATLYRACAAR